MRTLELFAGTQSFTKGVNRNFLTTETVTVDILSKYSPTYVTDILKWDYKQYAPQTFDIIWCSPPCTEYSKAKSRGIRNLDQADALVRKCFEIIHYFNPKMWVVENVGTGLLVNRMESIQPNLNKYFVDYCCYGKPYRKRTCLWSNIELNLQLCKGKDNCTQMIDGKHKESVGNGNSRYNSEKLVKSVWDKNSIPESLIDSILQCYVASMIE